MGTRRPTTEVQVAVVIVPVMVMVSVIVAWPVIVLMRVVIADPVAVLEASQRRRTVRRCVEDLDEPYRTVVHLHYWMRCSVSEIASRLGLQPGTVKSHLHRARAHLARRLAAEERHE